jgi:hypothetical protein
MLAAGMSLLAFVAWVFDPGGPSTFRWILLVLVAVFAGAAMWQRDRARRQAVQMVNAAGLAILLLQLSFLFSIAIVVPFAGGADAAGPGFGWCLVMLAAGFGLVAYSAIDRESGPGYLGAVVLVFSIVLIGRPHPDADLLFWPLFLLALGIGVLALGMRPRRPLPPEPGPADPPAPATPLPPPD